MLIFDVIYLAFPPPVEAAGVPPVRTPGSAGHDDGD